MKRVTGIGGVFFKAKDPKALSEWYARHLGLPMDEQGYIVFQWGEGADEAARSGSTVWSPFPDDTTYFNPSDRPYMFNFRVADLDGLLAALRDEGVTVDEQIQEMEFGRFGWIADPEGNRIELWEPAPGF